MKRLRSHRGGYTIVETLIYLGVTSILFVSAAILISGKQAQTEYNQAIREVESFIGDINNDISTGYYPSVNIGCQNNGSGPELSGTASLGTSGDCLFLGRFLHISPSDASDTEQTINVYTIVGTRLVGSDPDSAESKTLVEARARAFPDELKETKTFSPVLSFKWLKYNWDGANGNNTTAFGFISDLNPLSNIDGGSAVAGTVTVADISPVISVGNLPSGAFNSYDASSGAFVENPGQIALCVESNALDAHSIVTIDQSNTGGITTSTNYGEGCPPA